MTATATASVTIAVPVITAGACPALPAVKAMGVIGNSCGNIRGLRDQISIAGVCNSSETPMPLISGAGVVHCATGDRPDVRSPSR